jgi:hypothetical protein
MFLLKFENFNKITKFPHIVYIGIEKYLENNSFHFFNSKNWIYQLIDDCYLGHITKLKKITLSTCGLKKSFDVE